MYYFTHIIEVRRTQEFIDWLRKLKDQKAKVAIAKRIARVEAGNFGDYKEFDGIGELRFFIGPGYRVYYERRGDVVVLLLNGGDKDSQAKDIERAKRIAKEYE